MPSMVGYQFRCRCVIANKTWIGGNDVFVDIGDKRLGVVCCRQFFGDIGGGETLHIGGK